MSKEVKFITDKNGNEIARKSSCGNTWMFDTDFVNSMKKNEEAKSSTTTSSLGGNEYDYFPFIWQIVGAILGILAFIGFCVVVFWFFSLIAKDYQNHRIIKQIIEMVGMFTNVQGR